MHSAKSSMASHHLGNYGVTLAWEWGLAGLAYWGLRLRKTPLRAVLGERRRGRKEFFIDVGVAGLFWIFSLIVLAVLAVVFQSFHMESAQKQISQLAPASLAEAALWIALSVSAGICEEFVFADTCSNSLRARPAAFGLVCWSRPCFSAVHTATKASREC